MTSLLDIAPAAETVRVRGVDLSITGISANGLASLLTNHPELRSLFTGGEDIDTTALLGMGGTVVAAIIAAGTGDPGNPTAIEVADKLGIADQATIMEAILRHTLPDGIGPFAEKLSALAAALGVRVTTA